MTKLLAVVLSAALAWPALPASAQEAAEPQAEEQAAAGESSAREGSRGQDDHRDQDDERHRHDDGGGYKPDWGAIILGGAIIGLALAFKPSKEDERAVDSSAVPEIESKYKVVRDGPYVERLERVTARLKAAIPVKEMRHEVHVAVLDSKEVNAFTLPGGHIYFFTGLMDRMPDDDQLAGVLGHEIGHVNRHHFRTSFSQSLVIQGLFYAGIGATGRGGRWKQEAVALGGNVLGTLALLKFSRNHEYEADRKGVEYSRLAGYPADSMARGLQALMGDSGDQGPPGWLRTHPPTPDRVARATPKPEPAPEPYRQALDHSGHVMAGLHRKGDAAVMVHAEIGDGGGALTDLVYQDKKGTWHVPAEAFEAAGFALVPEGLVELEKNRLYAFAKSEADKDQKGFDKVRDFVKAAAKARPRAMASVSLQPEERVRAVAAELSLR